MLKYHQDVLSHSGTLMSRILTTLLICTVFFGGRAFAQTGNYPVIPVCECNNALSGDFNNALHSALLNDNELVEAVDTSDSRSQYLVLQVAPKAASPDARTYPVTVTLIWRSRRLAAGTVQCTQSDTCAVSVLNAIRPAVRSAYSSSR